MPLSLWYSQWSSLTPLSPCQTGSWLGRGGRGGLCVRMGGADEDEEEVVVEEVLIPLGGQWGGEV